MYNTIKKFLKNFRIFFRRNIYWHNLKSLKPVSRYFGFDRGTPIDRYYIEKFLEKNKELIKGRVLEVGDNEYTKKFGINVLKSEILHFDSSNKSATIICDLTKSETVPEEVIDCFICTQTYNFIYDFKTAILNSKKLLVKNGVLLATVAGLTQISRYDMNNWGDYWRFTTLSISKVFNEIFGKENVEICAYGNVLTAVSILNGICAEELKPYELDYYDDDYQILIAIKAFKK